MGTVRKGGEDAGDLFLVGNSSVVWAILAAFSEVCVTVGCGSVFGGASFATRFAALRAQSFARRLRLVQ